MNLVLQAIASRNEQRSRFAVQISLSKPTPEAAQALATTPWGGRFYGRSGFPPDLDRRQPYSPLTHRSAAIAHSIALRTNMSAIENHKTDPAPRQTRLQSAAAEFSQVSSVQQERVA